MPPIRPATGPDINRLTGRREADSTVAMPPEDCISWTPYLKPASCMAEANRSTYVETLGPTKALRATVEKRSYSR